MRSRIARWILAAALPAALVSPAQAENLIGAAAGSGRLEDEAFDGEDSGFKVIVGRRMAPIFGLELQFVDFGEPDDSLDGIDLEAKVRSIDLMVLGIVPVKVFEFFVKLGYGYWEIEPGGDGEFPGGIELDEDGFDFVYGIGAGVLLGDHVSLRVEWEDFDVGAADDLTFVSAGIDVRF